VPRKVRRPNLDTVLAQAVKAGHQVKRVTFTGDGGFTLVFVEDAPTTANAANDVDRWFEKNAG
jgi:galactokinase/mevalonate kinase-like predicted kinase